MTGEGVPRDAQGAAMRGESVPWPGRGFRPLAGEARAAGSPREPNGYRVQVATPTQPIDAA